MKLIFTNEDEAIVEYKKIKGEVFLIFDGQAELKITECPEKLLTKHVEKLYFKTLHKLAKSEVEELVLIVEKNSPVEAAVGESLKIRYAYSEYMFKYEPEKGRAPETDPEIKLSLTKGIDEEDDTIIATGEDQAFSAKLRPYGGGYYIHDVLVKEELRRQGYGTKYMTALVNSFKESELYLQVSSQNEAACGLYRKIGFVVSSELMYYESNRV